MAYVKFNYNSIDFNKTLFVEAEAKKHSEMWGCDADGNRGELRTFIDDLEIRIFLGKKDITDLIEEKHQEEFFDITEMAEERLYEEF